MAAKKSKAPKKGGFKRLVTKIKKQGNSEEAATKIAASIERKKYGNAKINRVAAAGRKKSSKRKSAKK